MISRSPHPHSPESLRSLVELAQVRSEKCELLEAKAANLMALEGARASGDLRLQMEVLAGLLRLAAEAIDEVSIRELDQELDELMAAHPKDVPPLAWQCKGVVASYRKQYALAQRCFHRFLCLSRSESEGEIAKGWVQLATHFRFRGLHQRSRLLSSIILKRYEDKRLRSINGLTYINMGCLEEAEGRLDSALGWFRKAHAAFLGEHNWYYHLYVLLAYARIHRKQGIFDQAKWYVELLEQATPGSEFGLLRREIALERSRLKEEAVDLVIDASRSIVKTRENGEIPFGKQYVLLEILKVLLEAHDRDGKEEDRGVSKAEIIQAVWKQRYRPHVHDNKLYYNINRLRKLIEPDMRRPQYLLNWKEGYRLAPGLRVQAIQTNKKKEMGE